MLRAVLDTNVVVSAFIRPAGPPGQILNLLTQAKFDTILSPALVDELRRTLQRPGVRKYVRLSEYELEGRLAQLETLADPVEGALKLDLPLRDAGDLPIFVAAVEGRADVIVTGDRDLLALKDYEGIRIVTPREFLDLLSAT